MELRPCKHLDYNELRYAGCELRTFTTMPEVRYWHRLFPGYEGAAKDVQFCKKRGRINEVLVCYHPDEKSCYEPTRAK